MSNKKYTGIAASIHESKRSKIPPCPYTIVPLSFTPTVLLTFDSSKSPISSRTEPVRGRHNVGAPYAAV